VTSLDALLSQGPLRLGGPRKALFMLGNRPIARLAGPHAEVSALVAHVGGHHGFAELVATLMGNRPSAILAVAGAAGDAPVAVHLRHGALAGLVGPGALDQLGPWAMEFQRRHGMQWDVGKGTTNLRRLFLYERLLEAFAVADRPGAWLVFVQGALTWLGDERTEEEDLAFHHLLLEYARRKDELPRVEGKLGGAAVVPVPMSEPGDVPGEIRRNLGNSDSRWDFKRDLDDAAQQEWLDARRVFRLCDGALTLHELAELSMLGRFRTFTAITALAERNHVHLVSALQAVGD